jgi:HD superfamily phosphohydrolase
VGQDLEERVNSFVGWLFEGFEAAPPRGPKVFNDALLGNQYFTKAEVALIDSPLLQRLKKIKQTGLVYQVFPSATHTRFEHCLGACTLAERSFKAIQDRFSVEYPTKSFPASPDRLRGDLAHLRMAALLHDVGHGLCSHASEQIYETLTDIQEFKKKPAYANNAPGEILSHLIVKSEVFREWFQENVVGKCHVEINLDVVAEMILGKHPDADKHFLAQIISSPYDADKLDYIARDSYYCGLALTVDLARFYSMISTALYRNRQCLALRSYVPLEQILFSKMTLYGSVYHHPKVKCLDAMLRSLIRHIAENADQCGVPVRDKIVGFADPVEYLYVTDEEFFNQFQDFGDEFVRKMLKRFRQRDLFFRCMEISRRTVANWDDYHRRNLVALSAPPRDQKRAQEENPELSPRLNLYEVEREIHKRLPTSVRKECNLGEVLLSVPGLPQLTGDFAYIQTAPEAAMDPIDDFFPLPQWTLAYAHNKWRSFLYAPRQHAPVVRDAAIPLLKELLGIEINCGKSNQACHLT